MSEDNNTLIVRMLCRMPNRTERVLHTPVDPKSPSEVVNVDGHLALDHDRTPVNRTLKSIGILFNVSVDLVVLNALKDGRRVVNQSIVVHCMGQNVGLRTHLDSLVGI